MSLAARRIVTMGLGRGRAMNPPPIAGELGTYSSSLPCEFNKRSSFGNSVTVEVFGDLSASSAHPFIFHDCHQNRREFCLVKRARW